MTKKNVTTTILVLIGLIAAASVVCLLAMPRWKGLFMAGCGGFLILNLLLSLAFIRTNYKERKRKPEK